MSTLRAESTPPVAMVNGSNSGISNGSTVIDRIVVACDINTYLFHRRNNHPDSACYSILYVEESCPVRTAWWLVASNSSTGFWVFFWFFGRFMVLIYIKRCLDCTIFS